MREARTREKQNGNITYTRKRLRGHVIQSEDTTIKELSELLQRRMDALRRKDAAAFMSFYSERFDTFELGPPLQYVDCDRADTGGVEGWFASFDGPVDYEIRDLRCRYGGDHAYCYMLYHLCGTKTDGSRMDMWTRQTLGMRRSNGEWKIEHAHLSVPFHMEDGRAAVDLNP